MADVTSTVSEFYSGQSIFLTGVTGFLGKSVLEKLLRSCPQIGNIFVLVRSKKGHCPLERVDALFESTLFDKVQTECPSAKSKVVAIAGDMLEDGLGISDEDRQRLIDADVSVVIHSAATVRFDERLRLSLQLNVGGVQKVLDLCRKLPNLKALVHVSTAYANCDQNFIKEQVYPPPVDPHKLLDALDWLTDDAAGQITPVLLGKKPNTYTYTKHLAENLLIQDAGSIPYVIVRPSIVGASWKEPFSGWIDNFNGPSGLFIACGMGILRTMMGNPDAIADIVPVDVVANVIICAPWYKSTLSRPEAAAATQQSCSTGALSEVPILTICSGAINPLRWNQMYEVLDILRERYPYKGAIFWPNATWTMSRLMYFMYVFTCHRAPAAVMDTYMRLIGKEPRMMTMYKRLHRAMETLSFFTQRHWEWEVKSLLDLQKKLSPADRTVFNTDLTPLNWSKYLENFCVGTKKYVLNEDLSDLQNAKNRMSKLKTLHYLFNLVSAAVVWRLITLKSEVASKLWSSFVRLFMRWMSYLRISRAVTL